MPRRWISRHLGARRSGHERGPRRAARFAAMLAVLAVGVIATAALVAPAVTGPAGLLGQSKAEQGGPGPTAGTQGGSAERASAEAQARREAGETAGRRPRAPDAERARTPMPRINWRRSRAIGSPSDGRLVDGVMLPASGPTWLTWDPINKTLPNRGWRRWGTDRLIRTTLRVLRRYARRHPQAEPVLIGDLSRPRGGDFGPQFGSIGHASHQNGLDIDIYYPRRDGRLVAPRSPGQVDMELSQELVDLFVEAGAEKVFVGPSLPFTGPADVVVPLVHHDNHLHARLPAR